MHIQLILTIQTIALIAFNPYILGLSTLTQSSSDTTLREESPPPYAGVVPSKYQDFGLH